MATIATRTLTGIDQWTTPVQLTGFFNLSISGTFVAVITVQRSPDKTSWFNVDTFTKETEDWGMEPEVMWYRVGIKNHASDYTSGSATVRLGQDGAFKS